MIWICYWSKLFVFKSAYVSFSLSSRSLQETIKILEHVWPFLPTLPNAWISSDFYSITQAIIIWTPVSRTVFWKTTKSVPLIKDLVINVIFPVPIDLSIAFFLYYSLWFSLRIPTLFWYWTKPWYWRKLLISSKLSKNIKIGLSLIFYIVCLIFSTIAA